LYHCGHATQSTSCDQTVSGEAAISTIFCAKTIADAGACSAGQVIRGSGICAGFSTGRPYVLVYATFC